MVLLWAIAVASRRDRHGYLAPSVGWGTWGAVDVHIVDELKHD